MTVTEPRTARGQETKRKILEAAEEVFTEHGYAGASVSKITDRAGVGQGTFYLYFPTKHEVFVELVDDLNRRVRHAMSVGAARGATRLDAEREGFREYFRFIADHPGIYRVVREAEFVAPEAMRRHYTRIVDGYVSGLETAKAAGEVDPDLDSTVTAWALMGVGEMIGMRWILWDGSSDVPDEVLDEMTRFIRHGLGSAPSPTRGADRIPHDTAQEET